MSTGNARNSVLARRTSYTRPRTDHPFGGGQSDHAGDPACRPERRLREQPWLPSQLRLRSADRGGAQGRRSRGGQRLGARLTDGRARRKASGRRCEVRADPPGLCQRCRKCMRPQIPGLSPGGLGPHHTSSGFPCGLSSGFPVARRVLPLRPPSSGFPSSGVLRLFPSAVARFRFSFGFPPGSLSLGQTSR